MATCPSSSIKAVKDVHGNRNLKQIDFCTSFKSAVIKATACSMTEVKNVRKGFWQLFRAKNSTAL